MLELLGLAFVVWCAWYVFSAAFGHSVFRYAALRSVDATPENRKFEALARLLLNVDISKEAITGEKKDEQGKHVFTHTKFDRK